jgi:hypothetical protein
MRTGQCASWTTWPAVEPISIRLNPRDLRRRGRRRPTGPGHPLITSRLLITSLENPMSKNILLAVDAASHDRGRPVLSAANLTRDLSRDSGDHVIVGQAAHIISHPPATGISVPVR